MIRVTDSDRSTLHPRVVSRLDRGRELVEFDFDVYRQLAGDREYGFRLVSTLRTLDEQGVLYSQGRSIDGYADKRHLPIVTNAVPSRSFHNWGLAFDLAPVNRSFRYLGRHYNLYSGDVAEAKEAWVLTGVPQAMKAHGLTWGGDWSFFDPGHFQLDAWVPVDESLAGSTWWEDDSKLVGIGYVDPSRHPYGDIWLNEHSGDHGRDEIGDMSAQDAARRIERWLSEGKTHWGALALLLAALWLLVDGNYQRLKRSVEKALRGFS